MSDYKQMQVYSSVKAIVQDYKKKLKLKNESEVIAYLSAIYDKHRPKLTIDEHEEALQKTKEIINQASL